MVVIPITVVLLNVIFDELFYSAITPMGTVKIDVAYDGLLLLRNGCSLYISMSLPTCTMTTKLHLINQRDPSIFTGFKPDSWSLNSINGPLLSLNFSFWSERAWKLVSFLLKSGYHLLHIFLLKSWCHDTQPLGVPIGVPLSSFRHQLHERRIFWLPDPSGPLVRRRVSGTITGHWYHGVTSNEQHVLGSLSWEQGA